MTETGLTTQAAVKAAANLEGINTIPVIPWMRRIEEHDLWPVLSKLAVTMSAELSLSRFRVRDLLGLADGQVFETASPDSEDVPLKVGDVQLGWTEFEVLDQKIAVRLTRLS
jgi:flagellar motor switch protein FliN/FliY